MEKTYKYRGYTISRGSYVGTGDDCLSSWYVDRIGAQTLDRRGSGYDQKKLAKQAIDDHLDFLDGIADIKGLESK